MAHSSKTRKSAFGCEATALNQMAPKNIARRASLLLRLSHRVLLTRAKQLVGWTLLGRDTTFHMVKKTLTVPSSKPCQHFLQQYTSMYIHIFESLLRSLKWRHFVLSKEFLKPRPKYNICIKKIIAPNI